MVISRIHIRFVLSLVPIRLYVPPGRRLSFEIYKTSLAYCRDHIAYSKLFVWYSAPHSYDLKDSDDQIQEIVLIDLNENEEETVLRVLNQDEFPGFLDGLRSLPCKRYWNDPSRDIAGHIIEITYKSGVCEQIGAYCNRRTCGDKWR